MKRILLLAVLLIAPVVLLMGEQAGGKKSLKLEELVSLMAAANVQVESCHLQGWAVLQDSGDVADVWRKNKIAEKLGLSGITPTVRDDSLEIMYASGEFQGDIVVQKIEKAGEQDLFYFFMQYNFKYDNSESLVVLEKKVRNTLNSLGEERGVYLTVKGRIGTSLDEKAKDAWAGAVLREIGAEVKDIIKTDGYTSITGYIPFFSNAVVVGREKTNINLAITCRGEETLVLLGSPLITCEY